MRFFSINDGRIINCEIMYVEEAEGQAAYFCITIKSLHATRGTQIFSPLGTRIRL